MKHKSVFVAVALCVAMLLSGCSGGSADPAPLPSIDPDVVAPGPNWTMTTTLDLVKRDGRWYVAGMF